MTDLTAQVWVYREGATLHARVVGPVDRETFPIFQQRLEGVTREQCSTLALDLGAAEYLDSEGVRWLQRLRSDLGMGGIALHLLFPEGSRIERVLMLLGLANAFTIKHYPGEAAPERSQIRLTQANP